MTEYLLVYDEIKYLQFQQLMNVFYEVIAFIVVYLLIVIWIKEKPQYKRVIYFYVAVSFILYVNTYDGCNYTSEILRAKDSKEVKGEISGYVQSFLKESYFYVDNVKFFISYDEGIDERFKLDYKIQNGDSVKITVCWRKNI